MLLNYFSKHKLKKYLYEGFSEPLKRWLPKPFNVSLFKLSFRLHIVNCN